MTAHPAHITRRAGAGYPPPGPAPAPPPGPGEGGRAAVSPRTDMMGKMNNIADFVLGSAVSPKQQQQLAGIENPMGRMSIGQLMSHQEDAVNKNKPDKNGTAFNDNVKVKFLGSEVQIL